MCRWSCRAPRRCRCRRFERRAAEDVDGRADRHRAEGTAPLVIGGPALHMSVTVVHSTSVSSRLPRSPAIPPISVIFSRSQSRCRSRRAPCSGRASSPSGPPAAYSGAPAAAAGCPNRAATSRSPSAGAGRGRSAGSRSSWGAPPAARIGGNRSWLSDASVFPMVVIVAIVAVPRRAHALRGSSRRQGEGPRWRADRRGQIPERQQSGTALPLSF